MEQQKETVESEVKGDMDEMYISRWHFEHTQDRSVRQSQWLVTVLDKYFKLRKRLKGSVCRKENLVRVPNHGSLSHSQGYAERSRQPAERLLGYGSHVPHVADRKHVSHSFAVDLRAFTMSIHLFKMPVGCLCPGDSG